MSFSYTTSDKLKARRALYDKFSLREQSWDSWLIDNILEFSNSKFILDIGGGYGSIWSSFSQNPFYVVLTDISFGMLVDAEAVKHNTITPRVVMDANKLAVKSSSIDIVTAFNVLYHIENIDLVYEEVIRILKRDGVFFFTTTGNNHLIELRNLIDSFTTKSSAKLIATGFSLQRAESISKQYFSKSVIKMFPDSLDVVDPSVLIDYIKSTPVGEMITNHEYNNIKQEVESHILSSGAFRITTETGLVVCSEPFLSKTHSALRNNDCPFCTEDPDRNEFWIKIIKFKTSKLCLSLDQTYMGQCLLIFDNSYHATNLDDLDSNDYISYMAELRIALIAIRSVFSPDHVNIELLGNVIPHLHIHIIPRYCNDPRWKQPIWTTSIEDMQKTYLTDQEYSNRIRDIRLFLEEHSDQYTKHT